MHLTDKYPFKDLLRMISPALIEDQRKSKGFDGDFSNTGINQPFQLKYSDYQEVIWVNICLCIDFRKLNPQTIKDAHPIP